MAWRSLGEALEAALLRMLNDGGCDLGPDAGKHQAAQFRNGTEVGCPTDGKWPRAVRPAASQGGNKERRTGGVTVGSSEPTSRPKARRVPLVHDASRSIATVMHRPLREPAPGSAVVIDLLAERERRHATCSAAAASLHRPQSAMLENPPHVPGSRQSG